MASPPITSFNLPKGERVDVYLVKLADGSMVTRTRAELEQLPPATVLEISGSPQPGEKV